MEAVFVLVRLREGFDGCAIQGFGISPWISLCFIGIPGGVDLEFVARLRDLAGDGRRAVRAGKVMAGLLLASRNPVRSCLFKNGPVCEDGHGAALGLAGWVLADRHFAALARSAPKASIRAGKPVITSSHTSAFWRGVLVFRNFKISRLSFMPSRCIDWRRILPCTLYMLERINLNDRLICLVFRGYLQGELNSYSLDGTLFLRGRGGVGLVLLALPLPSGQVFGLCSGSFPVVFTGGSWYGEVIETRHTDALLSV
jgi:hypothetical protein